MTRQCYLYPTISPNSVSPNFDDDKARPCSWNNGTKSSRGRPGDLAKVSVVLNHNVTADVGCLDGCVIAADVVRLNSNIDARITTVPLVLLLQSTGQVSLIKINCRFSEKYYKKPSGLCVQDIIHTTMFINIQDPSDTRKGELRRAIRSQAALSSAGCRKTTIAAKAATGSNSPEESDKVVQKREKGKTKVIKKEPGILISPSASQPPSPPYFPPQISEWSTQTDPFRSFPSVDAWHASIPRLVDICAYQICIHDCEQD